MEASAGEKPAKNKVVVSDDGSIDMTSYLAEVLDAEVIEHNRNLGKGVV